MSESPVQTVNRRQVSKRAAAGLLDEWALSVQDLHRVLSVAQALFLTLTHHDEGLVRVALELITSKKSRHIFKWYEDWYDDDIRRNWFSKQVQEQLKHVLTIRDGRTPEEADCDEDEDNVELQAALARAEEAEAALDALRLEHRNAELLASCSENEAQQNKEALQEKSEQIAKLQERLRQSSAATQTAEGECKSLEAQLQDMVRYKAEAEGNLNQIMSRIHALEEEASALRTESKKFSQEAAQQEQAATKYREEGAALRQQLEALQSRQTEMAALQERCQQLAAEVQTHKAEAAVSQVKHGECEALRASTANAERKAASLEMALQNLQQQYDSLAAEYSGLQTEASALSASNKELLQQQSSNAMAADAVTHRATQTDASELDNLDRPAHSSAQAELDSSALEEARRRNLELKAENKRLTVALEELQQKMKDLMAACRAKGVDVDAIASSIGLGFANSSSVFERLYSDAKTRVNRMEKRRQQFYQAHKYDYYKGANIMQELEQSRLVDYYAPEHHAPSQTMGNDAPKQFSRTSMAKSNGMPEAIPEEFSSGWETDAPVPHAALAAALASRMTKGQHSFSADQLKQSSAFTRKGKLATGVHSHFVAPSGKSRGNKSKMGSSLGFSKATHIITSQTKIANAGDGNFSNAGGRSNPAMRATKRHADDPPRQTDGPPAPRHADDPSAPRRRDRKCGALGDRMTVSLPSLAPEKFRQTQ